MNLYKISQEVNSDYDTYDSAIVCAPDEETARNMCPSHGAVRNHSWCDAKDVCVEYIGEAASSVSEGIVLASFNAG
jgi:hypothetical protein